MMSDSNSEIVERFTVLRRQEEQYQCKDYLPKADETNDGIKNGASVNEECRRAMANWCYQMVSFCNFKHNTAAIALSYLDKYLSTIPNNNTILRDRRQFQLVCMCSLMIAVKSNESIKYDMIGMLSELSKGCFSKIEIRNMEMKILFGLGWRLCPTTASDFLEILFSNNYENRTIRKLALTQIESAAKEYDFVTSSPSSIALAAMLNAISMYPTKHDDVAVIDQVMNSLTGKNEIEELQSKLKSITINLPQVVNQMNEVQNNEESHCADRRGRRVAYSNTPKSPTSVRNWTHDDDHIMS